MSENNISFVKNFKTVASAKITYSYVNSAGELGIQREDLTETVRSTIRSPDEESAMKEVANQHVKTRLEKQFILRVGNPLLVKFDEPFEAELIPIGKFKATLSDFQITQSEN